MRSTERRPPANPHPKRPSRRSFIKDSSLIVAGGAVAGPLSLGSCVHAGGSDEIRVGLIGCGRRGTAIASQALGTPGSGARLVAMGDVFQDRLQASLRGLKGRYSASVSVPRDRQYVGLDAYRDVLRAAVDLVILASPPGFRPLHFDAAVRAGKHVFLEKPVAVDPAGVRRVLSISQHAQRQGLAVAVGLQRRHQRRYRETIRRLHEGAIGDIILTRVYSSGESPAASSRRKAQTELEYQLRNWHWFTWLGGDLIVDRLVHGLDVINWLKNGYPVSAQGQGGRLNSTEMDPGEIFDHHMVEFTYDDGSKLFAQCRHSRDMVHHVTEHAHGTRGTAHIGAATIRDTGGQVSWSFGRGGGAGQPQEIIELLRRLRQGDCPNEATYGAGSTLTAILGRMATQSGQLVTWDQALNCQHQLARFEQFTDLQDQPPALVPCHS